MPHAAVERALCEASWGPSCGSFVLLLVLVTFLGVGCHPVLPDPPRGPGRELSVWSVHTADRALLCARLGTPPGHSSSLRGALQQSARGAGADEKGDEGLPQVATGGGAEGGLRRRQRELGMSRARQGSLGSPGPRGPGNISVLLSDSGLGRLCL